MAELPYSFGPGIRPGQVQIRAEAEAACFGLGVPEDNPFYGPEVDLRNEPQEDREAREEVAKAICEGCKLKWPCLEWALDTYEDWGIWGGMNSPDRKKFQKWLRKRGSGDTPKGESLQNLLDLWQRTRRSKQPVAKIARLQPKDKNPRSRSVPDRERSGGVERQQSSQVAASPNRASHQGGTIPRAASVRQVPRSSGRSNRVATPPNRGNVPKGGT